MNGDEKSEIAALRVDIQNVTQRQTSDASVFHGRFKAVEQQQQKFDQQQQKLAGEVAGLRQESAVQTTQLAFLVEAEKRRANAEAASGVEMVKVNGELAKQKGERKGLFMKIVIGILGLFGVAAAAR